MTGASRPDAAVSQHPYPCLATTISICWRRTGRSSARRGGLLCENRLKSRADGLEAAHNQTFAYIRADSHSLFRSAQPFQHGETPRAKCRAEECVPATQSLIALYVCTAASCGPAPMELQHRPCRQAPTILVGAGIILALLTGVRDEVGDSRPS